MAPVFVSPTITIDPVAEPLFVKWSEAAPQGEVMGTFGYVDAVELKCARSLEVVVERIRRERCRATRFGKALQPEPKADYGFVTDSNLFPRHVVPFGAS